MDGDDPWFWDIDRVVVELCTESNSWASISYSRGKPDPLALETALREQEIDGSTLLIEVDDAVLKNELGIKKLGQLAPVKQILRKLRKDSHRYQDWRATYGSDETLGSHTQYTSFNASNIRKRSESPRFDTTGLRRNRHISPSRNQSGANDSGTSVKNEAIGGQVSANEYSQSDLHRVTWITDAIGSKRRKLDTEGNPVSSALHEYGELRNDQDFQPINNQPALPDELGQMQDNIFTPLTTADNIILTEPSVPGKQRKRIAPTLISSEIDLNRIREIPTQADMVVDHDPQNIEPGVIYKGDDGKKRLILRSQSGLDMDLPRRHQEQLRNLASASRSALHEGGKRALEAAKLLVQTEKEKEIGVPPEALSTGYLGKKKHSVNEIFYDSAELGKKLPSMEDKDETLNIFTQGLVSDGRRLYVHGLMRRFLRSDRQVIRREGTRLSAIRPYPTRLAPMHQAPSFTLFRKNNNGEISATREDLSKWPEVDPIASNNSMDPKDEDAREAHFDLPDNLQLGGPSSYDHWDPGFLEKWRYVNGGDAVLPLYGESDEEGEYDNETWNEIEIECGFLEKPLLPLKRTPLTPDEINATIDEGIAQIVIKWNERKLPKLQRQAWSLWKRGQRDGDKRSQIRNAMQHIDRINLERLPQMREKIHEEFWTSRKQLLNMTKIMEQSIFDREDQVWRISVWKSKAQPEKPPPREKGSKESKANASACEDGEDIMTEAETESFDDSDDFIDDNGASAEEGEHRRADDEAEDGGSFSQNSYDRPKWDYETPTKATNRAEKNYMKAPAEFTDSDELMNGIVLAGDQDETPHSIQSGMSTSPSHVLVRLASVHNVEAKACSPTASDEVVSGSQEATQDFVDLTILSSDTSGGEEPRRDSQFIDLTTTKKTKKNIKITFKRETTEPKESDLVLVSDDNEEADLSPSRLILWDPTEIAKVSNKQWEKVKDRDRLVIASLYRMSRDFRDELLELFVQLTPSQMWSHMVEVMNAILNEKDRVRGMDEKTHKNLQSVLRYFEIYAHCHFRYPRPSMHRHEVEMIMAKEALFQPFHKLCRVTLESDFLPESKEIEAASEEDSDPLLPSKRNPKNSRGSSSDAEEIEDTPRKIRKRKVFENAQARDLREQDRQRLQEQDERRRRLLHKLALSGSDLNADRGRIIINDAKHDDQGFVYVHEQISKRIKDHQIDGVRFMWSQIVTDDIMQGCLLAHTMGLGKTMQVITLLVAIAEAAQSPDKSVSSQIPLSLHVSKTLVLCPPSLLDNWMDELLMWAPPRILGQYRKFDSTLKSTEDRLSFIEGWYTKGGILIMSYDMFRKFINNSATVRLDAPFDEEEHAVVRKQLLDGPNIIIADEAHKMKNAKASITQAAIQFRSRSRIALTGSPLANNIEEYHTMIEWIAPNYLGPIAEFRAKYVEPIQQGLYLESLPSERRRSLKMLGVLREDLAPKVHRADISVLRKDLKPKVEFVITVPLTNLQQKAYSIYVKAMLGTEKVNKDGQVEQTTLWHWLAVLSLLCNHPTCFKAKLSERKEDAGKRGGGKRNAPKTSTSEEDEPIDAAPVWKVGVSEELVRQEMNLFKHFGSAIEAFENSNKTRLLLQILDASKAVGDKVLIFSQSIKTLDFLEALCKDTGRDYARLDGNTKMSTRQGLTKDFNTGNTELYLISTNAGGLGLNLPGANRVIIFDFRFNPVNEEQAVGRAYRIGQQKPVFVYRFVAGGTFEESIHNKAVFKMQLASRVVDKKNPIACAKKRVGDFLFEPRAVQQQDLSEFKGMDPNVLDKILDEHGDSGIRAIVMTDTFERHDHDVLTAEEQKEVMQLLSDEKLKRTNKPAWDAEVRKRSLAATTQAQFANQQKPPLAGSILPTAQVAKSQGRQVGSSSSALERPIQTLPNSTMAPVLSNLLKSPSKPEMIPIAGVNTKICSTTPAPDKSPSLANTASLPDRSMPTPGLGGAVSGRDKHLPDSSDLRSSSLNRSVNAMMLGVTENGGTVMKAGPAVVLHTNEPAMKASPQASLLSKDTPSLLGSQSTPSVTVRKLPIVEQAKVKYGVNKLADSPKPQPSGLDGSTDSPKSPQIPLSQRTPLSSRTKNPGKESARSPQAKPDLAFLEKVATRRQARIVEGKRGTKEGSSSSAQPRPAKLPSWALSEIKKANKGNSRQGHPTDPEPETFSEKGSPIIDLT